MQNVFRPVRETQPRRRQLAKRSISCAFIVTLAELQYKEWKGPFYIETSLPDETRMTPEKVVGSCVHQGYSRSTPSNAHYVFIQTPAAFPTKPSRWFSIASALQPRRRGKGSLRRNRCVASRKAKITSNGPRTSVWLRARRAIRSARNAGAARSGNKRVHGPQPHTRGASITFSRAAQPAPRFNITIIARLTKSSLTLVPFHCGPERSRTAPSVWMAKRLPIRLHENTAARAKSTATATPRPRLGFRHAARSRRHRLRHPASASHFAPAGFREAHRRCIDSNPNLAISEPAVQSGSSRVLEGMLRL